MDTTSAASLCGSHKVMHEQGMAQEPPMQQPVHLHTVNASLLKNLKTKMLMQLMASQVALPEGMARAEDSSSSCTLQQQGIIFAVILIAKPMVGVGDKTNDTDHEGTLVTVLSDQPELQSLGFGLVGLCCLAFRHQQLLRLVPPQLTAPCLRAVASLPQP